MHWIYLSPHFDDVALSCGGMVWEQAHAGDRVSIWTICAGKPPFGELSPFAQELHARWQTGQEAIDHRKLEDIISCLGLGAEVRYFSIPDCIYRRDPETGEFMYASEASLNEPLHPGDALLIARLQEELMTFLSDDMTVILPLALGNHVDHQLTRAALENLESPFWYYQDYPYLLRCPDQVAALEQSGWQHCIFHVSPEGVIAWQDSVAAHSSQISTFWLGESEMRQAVADYWQWHNGIRLWRRPTGE